MQKVVKWDFSLKSDTLRLCNFQPMKWTYWWRSNKNCIYVNMSNILIKIPLVILQLLQICALSFFIVKKTIFNVVNPRQTQFLNQNYSDIKCVSGKFSILANRVFFAMLLSAPDFGACSAIAAPAFPDLIICSRYTGCEAEMPRKYII